MRCLTLVVAVLLCITIQGALIPKRLAGPPSEFTQHAPANPLCIREPTKSATITLEPSNSENWNVNFPVDSTELFTFIVFLYSDANKEQISDFTLKLYGPDNNQIDLAPHLHKGKWQYSDSGEADDIDYYQFSKPQLGVYKLEVNAKTKTSTTMGQLIIANESPVMEESFLANYERQVDKQIDIVSTTFNNMLESSEVSCTTDLTSRFTNQVESTTLVVFAPDGTVSHHRMHDDGHHGDHAPHDGIFGGQFVPKLSGDYRVRVKTEGTTNGVKFLRSSDHSFKVMDNELKVSSKAYLKFDEKKATILVPASFGNQPLDTYNVYTELYGRDQSDKPIAISWLGGMTHPSEHGDGLELHLDPRWLKLAGALPPFELRNFRVEDADNHIPLSSADSIPVIVASLHEMVIQKYVLDISLNVTEITSEMRVGPRPPQFSKDRVRAQATGMVLSHGYCSEENPWSGSPAFANCNAYFFLDRKQAISHDEFAKRIAAYAAEQGLDSYTILGHSQGGCAGTHLLNYYWSGLDMVSNTEVVQSLGTPYQGTNAARYSWLLPNGCPGVVDDLTPNGASKWLPGITDATRKQVTYYYTESKSRVCNVATNLVISSPNDGITESIRAPLPGGNVGYDTPFEGECHTTGMAMPAQSRNEARNRRFAQQCP